MKKSDYKGLYESLNVNEDMKKQLKMLPHRQNHKKVYITATVAAIAVAALVIMQIVKRPSDIDISPYAAIINEQTQNTDSKIQMDGLFKSEGMGAPGVLMKYDDLVNANLFNNANHSIKDGVVLVDRFSKANNNQMSEEIIKDSIERVEAALGLTPEQRIESIEVVIKEASLAEDGSSRVRISYDNELAIELSSREVRVLQYPSRSLIKPIEGVEFKPLSFETKEEAIAFAKDAIESISGKEYVFVEEDTLVYGHSEGGYGSGDLIVERNSYFKPVDDDGSPLSKLDYLSFYFDENLKLMGFGMPVYPTHEYVATYPLISYEKAVQQVEKGNHLTYLENAKGEPIAKEDILASEFVYYHPTHSGQYTMPYYKFIVKDPYPYQRGDSDTNGFVHTYEIYVPAIEFEDIYADWQFKG